MPEKDPNTWNAATYALVAFWSIIGGLVSFYGKVRAGVARWLNLHELIGEMATSAFFGVSVGLACEWLNAPLALTFAVVGVAGHMGSRGIFIAEKVMQKGVEKHLGVQVDEPKEM